MGRSYWFECSRCGYRAKVSGRADRGVHLHVQTIRCRDCKELYDAVTRIKVSDEAAAAGDGLPGAYRSKGLSPRRTRSAPPSFQSALNRLARFGGKRWRWMHFELQCPISGLHRVQPWNDPDKCPKCGIYLEKSALPFRIWD